MLHNVLKVFKRIRDYIHEMCLVRTGWDFSQCRSPYPEGAEGRSNVCLKPASGHSGLGSGP